KDIAQSQLYPKLNLFATAEHTSVPTGLLPLPPNDLFDLIPHQEIPQPFSENIRRVGVGLSMPVFVKPIYTTIKKLKTLQQSAQAKNRLTHLQNQAIIVGANANLQFLDSLIVALQAKKESLDKTKQLIELKVKNGRAQGSALLIINSNINQVETGINDLKIKKQQAIATIAALTDIHLKQAVKLSEKSTVQQNNLFALKPLEKKLKADELSIKVEKQKLLPAVFLSGKYNHANANAYNNGLDIDSNFSSIALTLNVPLFNKPQYAAIAKSKIEYEKTQRTYEKTKLQLEVQAGQLTENLKLLKASVALYSKNVENKLEILKIAKASYNADRITIEDYLKYEDDVVLEKSNYYKKQAEKWQTLMQLAVIFGNNIEDIVQ
ncbi:MAG TPA: TolC family protein, partial [Oceanospirillales bacterium]|nr:TolC family protein [Oceanospirillales bacterium]